MHDKAAHCTKVEDLRKALDWEKGSIDGERAWKKNSGKERTRVWGQGEKTMVGGRAKHDRSLKVGQRKTGYVGIGSQAVQRKSTSIKE